MGITFLLVHRFVFFPFLPLLLSSPLGSSIGSSLVVSSRLVSRLGSIRAQFPSPAPSNRPLSFLLLPFSSRFLQRPAFPDAIHVHPRVDVARDSPRDRSIANGFSREISEFRKNEHFRLANTHTHTHTHTQKGEILHKEKQCQSPDRWPCRAPNGPRSLDGKAPRRRPRRRVSL